jgi:hypothetical protein
MLNNFFFFENCAVYKIMWKNIVQPGRPKMTIRRMGIACYIPKSIQTQTQNMLQLLLFHCNNVYTNVPQCNVTIHCRSCFFYN